jgi:ketohexokinase
MPADNARLPAGEGGPPRGVIGVGIATVDVVNLVETYPSEDAEVRALAQRVARGGNVANTLAVLRQLGHPCTWVGTLADDAGGELIAADLDRRGIDRDRAATVRGARTPTSYVALSRATGSRTIIHHRDLRELTAADFAAVPLRNCAWVHFEGRAPAETAAMIARVRRERPEIGVSVEIEKPRDGIERLLDGPTVLIFSRAFVEAAGRPAEPSDFLREHAAAGSAELYLLPWGSTGAYGIARGGAAIFAPACVPERLTDTLAAGDVFNAAVIDGLLRGLDPPSLLDRANRIAGHKCGREGLDGLIASVAAAGLL